MLHNLYNLYIPIHIAITIDIHIIYMKVSQKHNILRGLELSAFILKGLFIV